MKTNTTPLTDEQSKLAADHYRVALIAARKFRGDPDENLSAAHRGLIMAARCYDDSRGVPFAAFAANLCRQQLLNAYTASKRRRGQEVPVSCLGETPPEASCEDAQPAMDRCRVDDLLESLPTDRMRQVVKMIGIEGLPYRTVAAKFGLGLSIIARDMKFARAILKARLKAA